jgi:uncharacterized membrane protein YtjA (UPF0391 family)
MLRWALIFLIIALVAALFGFTGIAVAAAGTTFGVVMSMTSGSTFAFKLIRPLIFPCPAATISA